MMHDQSEQAKLEISLDLPCITLPQQENIAGVTEACCQSDGYSQIKSAGTARNRISQIQE